MERNINVAVYGSLKKDFYNHNLLDVEGAEFIKSIVHPVEFIMVDLGYYPALIETPNKNNSINFEIYKVDEKTLEQLDYLEGYPHYYDRKQIDLGNNTCWVYYMKESESKDIKNLNVVETGNWKEKEWTKEDGI